MTALHKKPNEYPHHGSEAQIAGNIYGKRIGIKLLPAKPDSMGSSASNRKEYHRHK
jgi:hypothetical protein